MSGMEYKVLGLTEEDRHYLEEQMATRSKICEVFGISQQELGIDPSLPSRPHPLHRQANLDELVHIPMLEEFMQEWADR